MAPPLLFLRHGNATPAVFRYTGATPSQIGNTFGTADDTGGSPTYFSRRNNVIQFQNKLYAATYDGVYKLQPDGVTWSKAGVDGGLTWTSPILGANARHRSGLYVHYIGTVPHLVGWFLNGSSQLVYYKLNGATGVWSEAPGLTTTFDANFGSPNEYIYRGVMHFGHFSGAQNFFTLDLGTGTFGAGVSPPNASWQNCYDYCVFNNRLFMVGVVGNNGIPTIYEYTGGTWLTSVAGLGAVTTNFPFNDAHRTRYVLFTDGTNMYAIVNLDPSGANTGRAWRAFQITSSFVVTNITTDVLPVGLRGPADGGSNQPVGSRFFKFVDVDTTPGTPVIYLYYAPSEAFGTSLTLYQWNGPGTPLTTIDTGGDAQHSWPCGNQMGGDRIWTLGEMDILFTNRVAVPGGQRMYFKCYGASGPSDKFVRFYFNKEGEAVSQQCTLASTATGGSATRNGNQVEQVNADDGTTEYSAVWDCVADSVANGDRVQVIPRISTT